MSSFLIKEKTKKSFEDKISKLSRHTQDNIKTSMKSFDRFCSEFYDGRNSEEIFAELNVLKKNEQPEAIREVLQNWIDWQYDNGSLTSGVQQYLSKIKRVFSHHGIWFHLSDFDEPLEFKPKIKAEYNEHKEKNLLDPNSIAVKFEVRDDDILEQLNGISVMDDNTDLLMDWVLITRAENHGR